MISIQEARTHCEELLCSLVDERPWLVSLAERWPLLPSTVLAALARVCLRWLSEPVLDRSRAQLGVHFLITLAENGRVAKKEVRDFLLERVEGHLEVGTPGCEQLVWFLAGAHDLALLSEQDALRMAHSLKLAGYPSLTLLEQAFELGQVSGEASEECLLDVLRAALRNPRMAHELATSELGPQALGLLPELVSLQESHESESDPAWKVLLSHASGDVAGEVLQTFSRWSQARVDSLLLLLANQQSPPAWFRAPEVVRVAGRSSNGEVREILEEALLGAMSAPVRLTVRTSLLLSPPDASDT